MEESGCKSSVFLWAAQQVQSLQHHPQIYTRAKNSDDLNKICPNEWTQHYKTVLRPRLLQWLCVPSLVGHSLRIFNFPAFVLCLTACLPTEKFTGDLGRVRVSMYVEHMLNLVLCLIYFCVVFFTLAVFLFLWSLFLCSVEFYYK